MLHATHLKVCNLAENTFMLDAYESQINPVALLMWINPLLLLLVFRR